MIINIAKQVTARGINIASSFICAIVIGNKFGTTAFAEYAFSISFINIFSAICLLGLEISIGREYFSNSFSLRKKISGGIVVTISFIVLSIFTLSLSTALEASFSSPYLLASAFITAITFYLANIIKYENSTHVFELIRGGGINTACLILLLTNSISEQEIENHKFVLYGSLTIFAICLLALITSSAQPQKNQNIATLDFISNSISLSFTALLSAIIVSGDLILSKLSLPQTSYENMALATRVSFLLAIPFVILNNNYSVEIVKLKGEWPLTRRLLLNIILAITISATAIIFFHKYLQLFSKNYNYTELAPIIYLIITSHAFNIASSGLIPYLACANRKLLNTAVIITTFSTALFYMLTQNITNTSPELKFSIVFYTSLLTLKLLIISLATFNFIKTRPNPK